MHHSQRVLIGALLVNQCWAGGFQQPGQEGQNLGYAFAGVGAHINGPSISFYNPAGLPFLQGFQASTGVLHQTGRTTLQGNEATTTFNTVHLQNKISRSTKKGGFSFLGHIAGSKQNLGFGLSVTKPFHAHVTYPHDSINRYMATETDISTHALSLSVAYQFGDFAFGFGPDYYMTRMSFKKALGQTPSLADDGRQHHSARQNKYSWHLGFLFRIDDHLQFGVTYRPSLSLRAKGVMTKEYRFAVDEKTRPVYLTAKLPEILSISVFQQLDARWKLLSTVEWTRWTRLRAFTFDYSPTERERLPVHYRNSWRIAFGMDYRLNSFWHLKTGVAYDQSPARTSYRYSAFPDHTQHWISTGLAYRKNNLTVDIGIAHIFSHTYELNEHAPEVSEGMNQPEQYLLGRVHNTVNIVGIQLTWNLV